jgi:NAD(P)-dependent dehydrogenase (short-subunit alcohol dehydrogenase family)
MTNTNKTEKVMLVTGATAGIGKVTAWELARTGATVVLVGRNSQKANETVREIQEDLHGNAKLDVIIGDLSSLKDIQKVANTFKEKYSRLDVLINNAGGFFSKRLESVDGYEMTLALNHLNYFYLTNLLLDVIFQTPTARIVNVSSSAHYGSKLNFSDIQRKKSYFGWRVYAESKLMNILFTRVLAQKLSGSHVTANSLHPGFVATNFGHGKDLSAWAIKIGQFLMAISPQAGARTSIYLATASDVEGVSGKYFTRCQQRQPSMAAMEDRAANMLWELSEDLVQKNGNDQG